MYKVRFHLGAGEHYMHWQIKDRENVEYYNPSKYHLSMQGCKLINVRKIAEKIFNGENKDVCAWIDCISVGIYSIEGDLPIEENFHSIEYNPRKLPHWYSDRYGYNIDGEVFGEVLTNGRKLFARK